MIIQDEPGKIIKWLNTDTGMRWSNKAHSTVWHHALIELWDDEHGEHAMARINLRREGVWCAGIDGGDDIWLEGSDIPPERI